MISLIIYNDTLFTSRLSKNTRFTLITSMKEALANDQSMRRFGIEVIEVNISISLVQQWLFRSEVPDLGPPVNYPIPGKWDNTPNEPFPENMLSSRTNNKNTVQLYKDLSQKSNKERLLKGFQKHLNTITTSNRKAVIILSFEQHVQPIGHFILDTMEDTPSKNNMFTSQDTFPEVLKMSTVEFTDAQSRRHCVMYTEDMIAGTNITDNRKYYSHADPLVYPGKKNNRRYYNPKGLSKKVIDIVFDISGINQYLPVEDIQSSTLKLFKAKKQAFLDKCHSKLRT